MNESSDTSNDFIREERRWSREEQDRADKRDRMRAEERTVRIGYVCVALAVGLVAWAIAWLAFSITDSQTEANTQRDVACYESGGTRTTIGTVPLCVRIDTQEVQQ